jgi:uncharacterized protein YcbX
MPITLAQIYRHPVKGLTPESLVHVALTRGEGLPQDRRFALAHGTTIFDPAAPVWLPKTKFLMLMKNERLAQLRSRFDEASGVLTIEGEGRVLARANILEAAGRAVIEDFFAAFMKDEASGRPKLVDAPGHMFSDGARKVVSIIGLASVRDLARVIGHPIDPRRFRANFYLEGGAAWEEFALVDREFRIGAVRLRGVKPIKRCAATNVDPESAARDLNIPLALSENFGHVNTGIYADVLEDGVVGVGDRLVLND